MKISYERARELVVYDPSSGVITRLATGASINYGTIRLDEVTYATHRVAHLLMTGEWPCGVVDHIDGNRKNNKWDNLRDVDMLTNMKNVKLRSNNVSGCPGVGRSRAKVGWYASIVVSGKLIVLGYFQTKEEAVRVRKEAEVQYGFHENHGRSA